MDTAQTQNPAPSANPTDQPTPAPVLFPKPAFLNNQQPENQPAEDKNEPVATNQPTPEITTNNSNDDYGKKLADELAKLDKIYDGEFTGAIPTKDGITNAVFLKEPPISTPEFLKDSKEAQMKAIEKAGLVGFIPNHGLGVIQGEGATKLYQFMHADDKKRFGEKMETSIGTIDYSYAKPELKSLRDLIGDTDLEGLTEVNLWNQATKTTAEIAEMKKFVLREGKVEEAIKEAYEITAKLAEKAG